MRMLFIDTTKDHDIEIAVKDGKQVLVRKKFEAKYSQAEKLLPEIVKILKSKKIKLNDIKEIQVANQGGGFTALRIGVVAANALGYALGIGIKGLKKSKKGKKVRGLDIVEPFYDKEPNITVKKSKD